MATLLFNSAPMLEAHFGVPAAGGILVAINHRLSSPEVGYILAHSGARFLLLDAELEPLRRPAECSTGVTVIRAGRQTVAEDPYEQFLSAASGDDPESWLEDEEETISINYTSGTTGQPKGVQYTYRGAYLNALSEVIVAGMSPDSVYLWTLPMFHCNGWCFPWAVTAVAARHVALRAVDPDRVWQLIDQEGVTHYSGAPTVQLMVINASHGASPRAAGNRDGRRVAAVADAARSDGRAELPHRPRVRPDRDLRPDHRLSRSGGVAGSCRSSSARSCSRARARPTRPPTSSASSTRRWPTSRRTPRRWARS